MSWSYPSREGLIIGGALVALHGYERDLTSTLRAYQVAGWESDPRIEACRNLAKAIKLGTPIVQEDCAMWDMLAYAQQEMRVSLTEWETVLKIVPLAPR